MGVPDGRFPSGNDSTYVYLVHPSKGYHGDEWI